MDKGYPKLFFRNDKGQIVAVQIKSYTLANSSSTIIHDLFDGKYEIAQCIIPKNYFQ